MVRIQQPREASVQRTLTWGSSHAVHAREDCDTGIVKYEVQMGREDVGDSVGDVFSGERAGGRVSRTRTCSGRCGGCGVVLWL